MTSRSSSLARLQTSRALLAAVDQLAEEFPHLSLPAIYVAVGDARVLAARRLPNVRLYREALESEARARLRLEANAGLIEVSAGTSGARLDIVKP
jgi:hypothetical protein